MIKSINVNKVWKLFGGCIYNLEVQSWCILYAGTYKIFYMYDCAFVGMNNEQYKMHSMYIKIVFTGVCL